LVGGPFDGRGFVLTYCFITILSIFSKVAVGIGLAELIQRRDVFFVKK